MPAWKAYFQINGYDFSRYPVIDFPVPEDLYAGIQNALSENRPLRDCPFYCELLRLAKDAIDLDEYRPEYADLFPDQAHVSIASCIIDDPGDQKRLTDRFRGLVFPEWTGPESCAQTYEDEECTRDYSVILSFDDSGAVSDLQVFAEGLVSESTKSSRFEACYPDYRLIADKLQKEYERQNA